MLKNFPISLWNVLNKDKENNANTTFKKLVALESTIALLKQNKLAKVLNVLLKLV